MDGALQPRASITPALPSSPSITPAIPPPTGIVSDFSPHTGTLSAITNAVGPICIAITTTALIIRILTKYRVVGYFKWDDWFACGAWLVFVPWTSLFIHIVAFDGGLHSWDVPMEKLPYILKLVWVLLLLWPLLMMCAQLSICVQIFNLFGGKKKGYVYWITHTLMVITVGIFTSSFFATLFGCSPIARSWDFHVEGHCINTNILVFLSALWNVITDLTVWILLLYTVWTLKIPRRKKLFISAIFITAFFAPVFAVLRLLYTLFTVTSNDRYYALQQLGLWSIAEATIYVLCGIMPLLPKFVQLVRARKGRRNYDPTPNSVHRSARFLNRRFTNAGDAHSKLGTTKMGSHFDNDPWMRPDEMTMKLTGLSAKGKGARHFNGRDQPPYRTLSSTDAVGMEGVREDEQELRRDYDTGEEEQRPEDGGEANFWLGAGIMKTVRIETAVEEADTPGASDERHLKAPWGAR